MYRRPPHAVDRSLMWWGMLLASGGLIYCWPTVVGHFFPDSHLVAAMDFPDRRVAILHTRPMGLVL